MAGSGAVWGIEIGQSALKALRCSLVSGEVVADAFDYIEYPKILSQPEADPEELIAEAMQQLLQRNDAFNEKVCISVPGQSGLAKFFKPPPVEVKKIADIVRYEARQQIPFDLADVVWDYQMMPGGTIEDGYALESEVGLFAMKREQSYRQLSPFDRAGMEVDVIQLAPIALYNMIAHDRLHDRVEHETFDPDDPPPSSVLLSIGTDSSDLIITNGFRIWQRSMPIGGNHFTRQLTKDLKLTFSKAEHLKRNAREAADPKLIFQTMRPVFNDLVTEVQRSIGFFRSIDKRAQINELLITGNTVKMPGLAAYLGKNLGFEVHVLDRFNRLGGDDVLSIPTFRDNATTFAVCYGLCLQGLGVSQVHASLVPQEILTQRMIRAKKPWTLAGMAALLVGLAGHYWFTEHSWSTTHPNLWDDATRAVSSMSSYHQDHVKKDSTLDSKLTYLNTLGKEVSGNAERRLMWLEILQAVNAAIPREDYPDGKAPNAKELPLDDRIDIHITEFETKRFNELSEWWTEDRARRYQEELANWEKLMDRKLPEDFDRVTGPSGPGWVIQLRGYHYYNNPKKMGQEGSAHVRRFLTTNFMEKPISVPLPDGQVVTFTPEEMGLSYPLQLDEKMPQKAKIPNPAYDPQKAAAARAAIRPGTSAANQPDPNIEPPFLEVDRLDFTFQLVWKQSTLSDRLEAKRQKQQEEEEQRALEDQSGSGDSVAMTP
jgi:type IV pilus assembly protein PilM